MKRTLFIWGIYFLSLASTTFAAGVAIQTVFPNTSNDAVLEYFDIMNSSCVTIPLGGYSIRDASGKVFVFPQESLNSQEYRRFGKGETGISLNNSDETLELFDPSGLLVDKISYATSLKDTAILFNVAKEDCNIESDPPLEPSVHTNSGELVYVDAISDELHNTADFVDLVFTGSLFTGALVGDFILEGFAVFPTNSQENVPLVVQCKILPMEPTDESKNTVSGSAQISGNTNLHSEGSPSTTSPSPSPQVSSILPILPSVTSLPPSSPLLPTSGTGTSQSGSGADNEDIGLQFSGSGVNGGNGSNSNLPISGISKPPSPQQLYLWDLDRNNLLDTIEIVYTDMLSGSLDKTKIFLYSAAGGISGQKIEGHESILSLKIEENRLILTLKEVDFISPHFNISANTNSHLRLKTYSGFGLTGRNGESAISLTYTQSFDGYNPSMIWNYLEYPDTGKPPPSTISVQPNTSVSSLSIAGLEAIEGVQSSGTLSKISNLLPLPSNGLDASGAIFISNYEPRLNDIIQSGLSSEGKCLFENCRINLSYQPLKKSITCSWDFFTSEGEIRSYSSCNPPIVVLGNNGGKVQLSLLDSENFSTIKQVFEISSQVTQREGSLVSSTGGSLKEGEKNLSLAKVEVPRATKIAVSQKKGAQETKKIAVKSPPKTSVVKKVAAKATVKEKSLASSKAKTESTKSSSGATKESVKKTTASVVQEKTPVITGVLGIAFTILGFVFAAYKKKTAPVTV